MSSSFTHRGFYDIISPGRCQQPVEASQQQVVDHFKSFFNRTCDASDVDRDFLQDFIVLTEGQRAELNREFDVDELRHVVQGMN